MNPPTIRAHLVCHDFCIRRVANVSGTNEVVRYEIYDWTFQFKTIPRERGDALLSALEGGRQLQEIHYTPGMICDPAPPRYWLNLILTNGSTNTIGISDRFVVLPDGYYGLTDIAEKQIAKVNDAFDADARQEKETLRRHSVSAPKPLVYTVGSVDDGSDAFRHRAPFLRRCNQMENNL